MTLLWTKRQQWTASTRRNFHAIDLVITKSDAGFTWWIDVLDRGIGQTHEEYSPQPAARSLTEAKRRATEQADALVERLIKARGGA